MNEKIPQPNQEKNLALERQEAVQRYSELEKEYNSIPNEDKEYKDRGDADKYGYRFANNFSTNLKEIKEVSDKIESIDKYREVAKSNENSEYQVGDVSDIEKMKEEKEKADDEIKKIKHSIEKTKSDLNELRAKLDIPPTDEIPSLMDKKTKLEKLLAIQNDLENKLNFENKKEEVIKEGSLEQDKMEQRFLKDNLMELSSVLRRMVDNQDSFRFGMIATNLENFSNMDELKSELSKIIVSLEDFAKNGLKDNLDALHQDSSRVLQIETSLRNLPSKIKNENERREFGQFVSGVVSKVSEVSSFINLKASRLQDYLNVK